MTLRQPAPVRPAPTAQRLAHEDPKAFAHEHTRLYRALEHAAQLAELAGHDNLARLLRLDRQKVWRELQSATCDEQR